MSNVIEERKINEEYVVRVKESDAYLNPRADENIGIFAIALKKYDWNELDTYRDGLDSSTNYFDAFVRAINYSQYGNTWEGENGDDIEYVTPEIADFVLSDIIYLPVYAYIHGGITINTSPYPCRWDSGQAGWIFTTKKIMQEAFGNNLTDSEIIAKAKELLEKEVEEFNKYLNGEVYDILLVKQNKCHCCGHIKEEVEEITSVLGYENLEPEIQWVINYIKTDKKE